MERGVGRLRHFQLLRDSLFSVFVDNIPGGKDASWLRKVFASAGEIQDVFIPSKERRLSCSRFGFVRFKALEEAKAAISRWNGSLFDRCRLVVKLADFGGKPRKSMPVPGEGQHGFCQEPHGRPFQFRDAAVANEVSFLGPVKKRKVSLEVIPENEEWMSSSAVAEMKAFIPSNQLEDELKLDGIRFHKIFPYGGMKVLIHFLSTEDLEVCLSGSFASISRRFSSCQKWKEEAPIRLRSVWLSIFGLPFKAWSEANFLKITAPFGSFLKTELRDFQESGLERVRVLVETSRLDRIFEAFEAMVGDAVFESVICEECFLNGRETEWRVEESMGEGEEEALSCSLNEGVPSRARQHGLEELGGGRAWVAGGGKSGEESVVAETPSSRREGQGPSEPSHYVLATPLGKVVSCEPSLSRVGGVVKESGKMISVRDVSDCSWNATLKSFLQQNGKRSPGLVSKAQAGVGLCLVIPGVKGQDKEAAQVEFIDSVLDKQAVGAADVNLVPVGQSSDERPVRVCDANVTEVVDLSLDDFSSQNEILSSGFGCRVGASVRLDKSKPSLARDFGESPHDSFKVAIRKVSKKKAVSKVFRRKKRAELDRLKKSYLKELETTYKPVVLEEDSHGVLEGNFLAEEERKAIQRKEAENTVKIAKALGMKPSLPDDEVVQFFINMRIGEEKKRRIEDIERSVEGEGKELNLVEKCSRSKLQNQCIKYLGPMERKAYEIELENGKFYKKQTSEILDTTGGPKGAKWIFVLSTSRTLYVGRKQKGTFQHSSFLAGGATLAAGQLVVENGILRAVWPHSGHYRPTEENFTDFISFLRENNVDLTNVQMTPVEEEQRSYHRQNSNLEMRINSSEEELTQKATFSDVNQTNAEHLAKVKISLVGEEANYAALEFQKSRKQNILGRKLTYLEIPTRDEFLERSQSEDQVAASSTNGFSLPLLDGYESPEEEEHDHEASRIISFDDANEKGSQMEAVHEKVIEKVNSRMDWYQLGKHLSCTWTSGVGPRIGCIRGYPSELQNHALEKVNLSPRSAPISRTNSNINPRYRFGTITPTPFTTQSHTTLSPPAMMLFSQRSLPHNSTLSSSLWKANSLGITSFS